MGTRGPISMDYSSLTVGGELTNQGNFLIRSSSGVTVGSLINSGMIDLDYASALAVNGDATNSGSIYLGELGQWPQRFERQWRADKSWTIRDRSGRSIP